MAGSSVASIAPALVNGANSDPLLRSAMSRHISGPTFPRFVKKQALTPASAHRQQGLREELGQRPEPCRRPSPFSQPGEGELRNRRQKRGRRQVHLRRVTAVLAGGHQLSARSNRLDAVSTKESVLQRPGEPGGGAHAHPSGSSPALRSERPVSVVAPRVPPLTRSRWPLVYELSLPITAVP